jgi:hypothetical protein
MVKRAINGIVRDLTVEEQAEYDARQTAYANGSKDRKLNYIKQIRLEKLIETDYLANSDVTMPDNIKTWKVYATCHKILAQKNNTIYSWLVMSKET